MITEGFGDSTGSYVRITGDEKDRISDAVIGSGCIRGICPLAIERVNGHREYVYDVTGYTPLADHIEENGITKDQWIKVLRVICDVVTELERHLLDGEHLVIEMENIYVSDGLEEVAGIYVSEHKKAFAESVMQLMERALK